MSHLVFVYGSLRQGMGNHRLLADSELLGTDLIDGWSMVSLGAYPAIYRDEKNEVGIVGEVYRCNELTFRRLDQLEGYPNFYDRCQVETAYGDAWVYYFKDSDRAGRHLTKVVAGDWCEYVSNLST